LLAHPDVARQAPQVLFNFQKQLQQYRRDDQIVAAAALYERSFSLFARLRQALRLSADSMHHLRQPHQLPAAQQQEMKTALEQLRQELQQQSQEEHDQDQPLAETVLKHLDKYWLHLVPHLPPTGGQCWQRTTNQLESHWGKLKRYRRQAHGRGKLTRDFQALPEEYPLVLNLKNATYLDLVLDGSLETLSSKLAQASHQAGSFSAWQRRRGPRLLGQLPRRILRDDDFINHLIDACEHQCLTADNAAA
jgi:hypothetical protein